MAIKMSLAVLVLVSLATLRVTTSSNPDRWGRVLRACVPPGATCITGTDTCCKKNDVCYSGPVIVKDAVGTCRSGPLPIGRRLVQCLKPNSACIVGTDTCCSQGSQVYECYAGPIIILGASGTCKKSNGLPIGKH